MKNLNPHYAVGGNFYFENEGRSASRAGFKVRLRKWLDRYSLDLSTGLLFWDSRYNAGTPITGSLGVNLNNWFGVVAQVESVPVTTWSGPAWLPTRKKHQSLYVGMKIGSKPGAWTNAVAVGTLNSCGDIIYSRSIKSVQLRLELF